jgi:glycosyltransferase involved in cell wall biosynthesis
MASLATLTVARRLGIPALLERPNAYTGYAYEVVADECRRLGLWLHPSHSHYYDPRHLAREEKEYRLADRLLCPSDFVAKTFLDAGFPASRIARHQYGFDPERFQVLERETCDDAAREFSIAFIGSCEPRKGLHYALDAWLASPASDSGRFHICGRFVPGYSEILAAKLAHPSIVEHGFQKNVTSVMQQCDALVLPSLEEGSALVTYEARACGCILLVSDAAGAPCKHEVDGLVHPARCTGVLQDQITMLASDPIRRENLRRASIAGLDALTWQSAGVRLREIYADTLAQRSARTAAGGEHVPKS